MFSTQGKHLRKLQTTRYFDSASKKVNLPIIIDTLSVADIFT